jgi:hypothetical protein
VSNGEFPRSRKRLAAISIGAAYIFYIVVFNWLANLGLTPLLRGVTARFWQQPNLTVFFFAGVALSRLCKNLSFRARKCHYSGSGYRSCGDQALIETFVARRLLFFVSCVVFDWRSNVSALAHS